MTSVALAVLTAAWPRVREMMYREGTSIATFVILTTISTSIVLFCGGRFRTFFIAIAVAPPFLLALPLILRSAIRHPEYPIRGFVEYFVCFVAAPIVLAWIVGSLLNRNEQRM